MARNNWTRQELIVAFNLYCKIPFSKINYRHKLVQQLANAIGRTPSAVAWKLVNFASLDPTLQAKNIKGASNGSKMDKVIFEEFYHDWETLAYESEIALAKLLGENVIDEELDVIKEFAIKEGKVKEATIKVRVNQNFFRKMILSAYENKCSFTGIAIDSLLVASHIVPWVKNEKNRLNPENGICLNNLHDKAFDRGLLTINMDYKIQVSKYLKELEPNETMQKFFLDYDNKKIVLPKRFLPNRQFLDYHNREIFKG